jgi:UDP-3-O-[3-hydroxymyristoyl] glucosamine N-acyltransferase
VTAPHFFKRPPGLTVGEIAALTGAEPSNGVRLNHLITNIAPLDRAGRSDLAFLDTAKYGSVTDASASASALV